MAFPEGTSLIRLSAEYPIKPFDCGDSDLNDFLLNDSKSYLNKLLAVTYILENEHETIAFFSLLNDKVSQAEVDSGNKWKKLFRKTTGKDFRSHPAMKIGRLGISNSFKGLGIGKSVMDYVKAMFISNNRTGCRYITIDAYRESLPFYEKNRFRYLTERDTNSGTQLMYFDLIELIKR
jgi:predicted GNAT family N-acyltransferase